MCVYVHIPVLANEVLAFLSPKSGAVYIDATLGLGGHTKLLLAQGSTVYGIDTDRRNLTQAGEILKDYTSGKQPTLHLINDNFENLGSIVETVKKSEQRLDGILFDLGISSVHVDDPARGFSFLRDGPLDMRLNPDQKGSCADLVNTASEEYLKQLIEEYGDEKFAHRIAYNIVQYRAKKPFTTTVELADFIAGVMHSRNGFYAKRALVNGLWPIEERERMHEWALRQKRHPATRTFQALRIAVNRETEVLTTALTTVLKILDSGSRIAVITFHSLEDRIVKNIFKQAVLSKEYMSHTKKPIDPAPEEIATNPRSRSAKLRGIIKR